MMMAMAARYGVAKSIAREAYEDNAASGLAIVDPGVGFTMISRPITCRRIVRSVP